MNDATPARKRVVVRRKNVNRGANAELLRLRQHRQELVEALQSLSHLLDEYAPTWYSEEHRELTVAALKWSDKRSTGRKPLS
jgi:hypothetical protein